MRNKPDVVVVGGGVVGCFAALHLRRLGCDVTLVERDTIGSGASHGNCGYICPSHVAPLCGPGAVWNGLKTMARFGGALSIPPRWDPTLWRWLWQFSRCCNEATFTRAAWGRDALLRSSMHQYRALAEAEGPPIQMHESGLLTVYRDRGDFEAFSESAERLMAEFGLQVTRYDGEELCGLVPELREGLAGGWHFPGDAHLSPTRLLERLRSELAAQGVTVREHCGVDQWETRGGQLESLRTDRGETLRADRLVLATGAESARWAGKLGCTLPIVPGKGYSVTLQRSDSMPTVPMIFEDDHVAVTPLGDAFRIGSTMQLTGFDRTIAAGRIRLLKRAAERHLRVPLPDGQETPWAGWRPMTPDGLPYIAAAPAVPNVFVAAGNGMIGIASAPATGQLVAELAAECPTHIDPTPYRLNRF